MPAAPAQSMAAGAALSPHCATWASSLKIDGISCPGGGKKIKNNLPAELMPNPCSLLAMLTASACQPARLLGVLQQPVPTPAAGIWLPSAGAPSTHSFSCPCCTKWRKESVLTLMRCCWWVLLAVLNSVPLSSHIVPPWTPSPISGAAALFKSSWLIGVNLKKKKSLSLCYSALSSSNRDAPELPKGGDEDSPSSPSMGNTPAFLSCP